MNQINLDINDFNYVGCFADTNQKQIVLSSPTRCDVNDNTIIIYGILNKYIHFYYISEQALDYKVEIIENLSEKVSCKLVDGSLFICSFYIERSIVIRIISLIEKTVFPGNLNSKLLN